MNCSMVMSKVDLYYEGRLSDTEAFNIEKHLEICGTCRNEYKEMEYLFNLLSDHQVALPPIDFTENVMKEISNTTSNKNRLSTVSRLGLSLVAAGLLIVSMNIMSLSSNTDSFSEYMSTGAREFNEIIINPFQKLSRGLDYLFGYFSN